MAQQERGIRRLSVPLPSHIISLSHTLSYTISLPPPCQTTKQSISLSQDSPTTTTATTRQPARPQKKTMPSGRRPTLGDEIADAYIFPQCTRRARPRIPAICVASPSGEVRLVVDIRPPRLDGPIEKQRRRRLRESLAEYEEELREEEEEPREEEAARDRGRVETCLVDQTDKVCTEQASRVSFSSFAAGTLSD